MKNMIVRNCYRGIDNANILNCTNVNLFYIEADKSICQGIYGLNILGDSHINFIKTSVLYIEYVDLKVVEKHHTLRIQHYHSNQSINTGCSKSFKLSIEMSQSSYIVTVKISELNIRRTGVIQAMFHSNNELLISDCHLIKNSDNRLVLCQVNKSWTLTTIIFVHFNNCQFSHNHNMSLIYVLNYMTTLISNCKFYNNSYVMAYSQYYYRNFGTLSYVFIKLMVVSVADSLSCMQVVHVSWYPGV